MKKLSEMNANYPIIILAIMIWAGFIMFGIWWTGGIDTGTSNTTLTEEEQELQKTKEETDRRLEEEARRASEELVSSIDEKNNVSEKANDTYQVGKPFNDGIIRIELLNYDGDFKDIDNYRDVKKSDKIIRAEFEIEYIKQSKISQHDSIYVSSGNFDCYADGYTTNGMHTFEHNLIYNSLESGNLTVGTKVKGSIFFLVPREAKEIFINCQEPRTSKYIKFKVE